MTDQPPAPPTRRGCPARRVGHRLCTRSAGSFHIPCMRRCWRSLVLPKRSGLLSSALWFSCCASFRTRSERKESRFALGLLLIGFFLVAGRCSSSSRAMHAEKECRSALSESQTHSESPSNATYTVCTSPVTGSGGVQKKENRLVMILSATESSSWSEEAVSVLC